MNSFSKRKIVFRMIRFFLIVSFCFYATICFLQQLDTSKIDTLKIKQFDIVLVKQNNRIINTDGEKKFHDTWTHAKGKDRYSLMSEIDGHFDFFKGFSPEQMEALLGETNKYGSYYIDNPVDENDSDPCVVQFVYENGRLASLTTNCP
jgi:hypothetical protein